MIRTRSSFKLLPSATKAALAARELLKRLSEGLLVEVRPENVEEQEFGVSSLPQEEIGETVPFYPQLLETALHRLPQKGC